MVERLPETYSFGNKEELNLQELVKQLERMYFDLARSINQKPDLYQRTTDGLTTDTFLAQGSININLNTNKVEMLTNHVNPTTVNWVQLSP